MKKVLKRNVTLGKGLSTPVKFLSKIKGNGYNEIDKWISTILLPKGDLAHLTRAYAEKC